MIKRAFLLVFAPVVLLTTGACFATRSDVRVLQGDILAFRQETARADSARARQIAVVAASLGVVVDSLRDTGNRLARFQGDTRGELRSVGEQLIRLQELVGQSQDVIRRFRAEQEERASRQDLIAVPSGVPPVTTTTDTTGAVPPAGQNPGPNQLFQDAIGLLRRQSYGTAQVAFQDLLRMHPTSDRAPDAQYWLAEAYDADGKTAEADSAFLLVVTNYPKSARAPTALYKMGLSLAKRGMRAEARAAMERVTREYASAAEADLASEWLRTNR